VPALVARVATHSGSPSLRCRYLRRSRASLRGAAMRRE
jgi:hypothetical protein